MPNPTRGFARFSRSLAKDADATIEVIDVAERRLGESLIQHLSAGRHELRWSAPASIAGVHIGQLTIGDEEPMLRRFVLVR